MRVEWSKYLLSSFRFQQRDEVYLQGDGVVGILYHKDLLLLYRLLLSNHSVGESAIVDTYQ
jgi:hypothetical protein